MMVHHGSMPQEKNPGQFPWHLSGTGPPKDGPNLDHFGTTLTTIRELCFLHNYYVNPRFGQIFGRCATIFCLCDLPSPKGAAVEKNRPFGSIFFVCNTRQRWNNIRSPAPYQMSSNREYCATTWTYIVTLKHCVCRWHVI